MASHKMTSPQQPIIALARDLMDMKTTLGQILKNQTVMMAQLVELSNTSSHQDWLSPKTPPCVPTNTPATGLVNGLASGKNIANAKEGVFNFITPPLVTNKKSSSLVPPPKAASTPTPTMKRKADKPLADIGNNNGGDSGDKGHRRSGLQRAKSEEDEFVTMKKAAVTSPKPKANERVSLGKEEKRKLRFFTILVVQPL